MAELRGTGRAAGPGVTVGLAPTEVRRDHEIYSIDGGWFKARWHFSFDQYYDPDNMGIGLMRVFNHDTLVAGAIWPMHPHRDIEGLTYVVAGHFEHADSLGNDGVLEPGGVQRMTLGSGSWHSERNYSKSEPMQFIQIWIRPNRSSLEPSVEQYQFTEDDRTNTLLEAIRPEGTEGPGVMVHQNVSVYISRLLPGAEVEHIFEEGRGGYLYLIGGALRANEEELTTGDAVRIPGEGAMRLAANEVSELILVDTPL